MYRLGRFLLKKMLTKEKNTKKPDDDRYELMMKDFQEKMKYYTTEGLRLYDFKSLEDEAVKKLRANRDTEEEETELTPYIFTGTTEAATTETRAPPSLPPSSPPSESKSISIDSKLLPIFVVTAFFGAVFIIGPLLVRKGKNKGIVRACIMMTAFCMWIFWFIIYVSQMNPLVGPRLENSTVAWIAYKWGKAVQE